VKKRKPVTQQIQQMASRAPDGRMQKDENQKKLDFARQLELVRK